MSPLALMCAMVLAVQAAAVKTSAEESAGLKTLERLSSEVMHGTKNASAMLGELEKMAMGGKGTEPIDDATVKQITGILNALTAGFPEDKIQKQKLATDKVEIFAACTESASNLVTKKTNMQKAHKAATDCRAYDPLAGEHEQCHELDNSLEAVATAVGELEEKYPTFPSVTDTVSDTNLALKLVGYVKEATGSPICQAQTPTIPTQWSDCQSETIKNDNLVITHKDGCKDLHGTFENKFCEWREEVRLEQQNCAAFEACQSSAIGELETVNDEIVNLNAVRFQEELAVKKIICYLTAWQKSAGTTVDAKDIKDVSACADLTKLDDDEIATTKIAEGTCTDGVKCKQTACQEERATADDVARANVFPNGPYVEGQTPQENPISVQFVANEYGGDYHIVADVHTPVIFQCPDHGKAPIEHAAPNLFITDLLQAHDSTPIAAEKPKREKKLVRREPKKPKASLAELDHQGRMTNVKVQAAKHSTTELHDMDMDALMELVKTSGANTAAIKAAMTKSIMKLQKQASAV